MINVYNESSLHKALKEIYALKYNGRTEVKMAGHIYDIVTDCNDVIEIQTQSLSSLYSKINDTLNVQNMNMRIVYPIVVSKTILVFDENGKQLSKRKSPKKGSIYDLFNEVTKIYPFLLNSNFIFETVEIEMEEYRIKTSESLVIKNRCSRRKKNWVKTDKVLKSLHSSSVLCTEEDYLNLLPEGLSLEFCAKDVSKCFIEHGFSKAVAKKSNLILWVLFRMRLIKKTKKENRCIYYSEVKNNKVI